MTNTAGLAMPALSFELWMPQSVITRRSVSHKIGNGSLSSRRNASDVAGGSTDTATTSAPAARISS